MHLHGITEKKLTSTAFAGEDWILEKQFNGWLNF